MPQYTVKDNETGKTVTFDWSGDTEPTDADMDAVFAEAQSSQPEQPSGLRRIADMAIDAAPMIGGIAGGTAGLFTGPAAPIVSPVLAALGGAAGSAVRQFGETLTGERGDSGQVDQLKEMAGEGAIQGAGQLGGQIVGKGAQLLARPLMRLGMGAQTAVRNKFPTVNLEQIALREGTNPSKIGQLSRRANQAVPAAAREADAAGAAPIKPSELIGVKAIGGRESTGLRRLFDKAGQARMPEQQAQIVEEANRLRKLYRGGASVEDALVGKTARQKTGRAALQSAADPRMASTSAEIDASVARALGDAAKARGGNVGNALAKSQELMALERALKNRDWMPTRTGAALGGVAAGATGFGSGDTSSGVGAGLVPLLLSSPRGGMVGARAVAQSAPALREATRLAILAILGEGEPDNAGNAPKK